MLTVKPISEIKKIIDQNFGSLHMDLETITLDRALNRVLAEDLFAKEYVPAFNRSTVDGYAVHSKDVFGCSDSIPAILKLAGESVMGAKANIELGQNECLYVPTGAEVPDSADAVVMLEYAEDYGDGTLGITKPCAPGMNLIYKGDDVKPGDLVFTKGRKLKAFDIGTLAALGKTSIFVSRSPKVGIISTGDELIDPGSPVSIGLIRDVNAPMLTSACEEVGAISEFFGIIRDEKSEIQKALMDAVEECDLVLISGGTSVGRKDTIPELMIELGELLIHGAAVKPGKPTILGKIHDKPVFGLPGNPVAAFFMFYLLVRPLIFSLMGAEAVEHKAIFPLSRAVPSNNGREDLVPVSIIDGLANPIIGKSGLITTLSQSDGFFRIDRDREGVSKGELVEVILLRS